MSLPMSAGLLVGLYMRFLFFLAAWACHLEGLRLAVVPARYLSRRAALLLAEIARRSLLALGVGRRVGEADGDGRNWLQLEKSSLA